VIPTLELWDWRRQVGALYHAVRAAPEPRAGWELWRATRNTLFAHHPQSPLEAARRTGFSGLDLFPYDPALRFAVALEPVEAAEERLPAGADGEVALLPFARTAGLQAALGGELTLYWIQAYAGGVFLPFRDATSGRDTYGAGRYLLDTIKSADLGSDADGRTVLDFNFAYNPSCAYSPRYVCPLAPRRNWLPAAIRAGERTPG